MALLQLVAFCVALFLILREPALALLIGGAQYGNPLGPMAVIDRITIAFWSLVVFAFFFVRFKDWAEQPPAEFARTPPRHCTTHSRYFFAQICYAGTILLAFWVLTFVPQLIDEILGALQIGSPEAVQAARAAFKDADLSDELAGAAPLFRTLAPAAAAPYAAVALLVLFARLPVLQEPVVRAFFQRRALIPSEARRVMAEIGTGRATFTADPGILQRQFEGLLKGLVDPRTQDHELRAVVKTEYVYQLLRDETDRDFDLARRDSDFAEIGRQLDLAREALRELVVDGRELLAVIETDLTDSADETITLDQIDACRRQMAASKQRVFDKAFKARRREALQRYAALGETLVRLMTTLVLASDRSSQARSDRFARFGFKLETASHPVPSYAMPATFLAVFLVCLATSLFYWGGFEFVGAAARRIVAVEQMGDVPHLLRIDTPATAAFWSLIGAMMHMFAVGTALAAWSLSPDYHFFERQRAVPLRSYFGAWFTGLLFGFVANVFLFFALGLILRDGNLLQHNWPWTLLGGVTGAFLLVQGINVRRERYRSAWLTAVAQAAVSALSASAVAVIWGIHTNVPTYILAPFSLYAGGSSALVGLTLGLLAMVFMRSDELAAEPALPPAASVPALTGGP